jgi:hypothetical protein
MPLTQKVTVALFILAFSQAASASAAETVFTDKMVHEAFEKDGGTAHEVMTRQRDRLRSIGDAFLIGDKEMIKQDADQIAADMTTVAETFPPSSENTVKVWKAMSDVAAEANAMKTEIDNKDYQKAFEHYSHLQASCIQCHQVARSWGKFETPAPERKEEPAPVAKKKAPSKNKTELKSVEGE